MPDAGTTTVEWLRPSPRQVSARRETALWCLGLPAALWAVVALLGVGWAWIPAGSLGAWLALIVVPARVHVQARGWACTADALLWRRGWVRPTVTSVPWSRVRSVELTEGPIEARVGMASLVVKIPGLGVPVGGLPAEVARGLRTEILERARLPITAPEARDREPDADDPAGGDQGTVASASAPPEPAAASADVPPRRGPGPAPAGPGELDGVPGWFRAHPCSGLASWLSAVLWLTATGVYLAMRESEDVPSLVGALGRAPEHPRLVVGACAVGALVVLLTIGSELRRRRTTWVIAAGALHERYAGRSRRHAVVPLERVDRVDLTAGLGERVLGLATLKVVTAADDDAVTIGSIPRARAERLRAELLGRRPESASGCHEQPAPWEAPSAGRPQESAAAAPRSAGRPIVVTDRRTVVRAFVLRDPVLPAGVAGVVGAVAGLATGTPEVLFPAFGALAFAGRRAWQMVDASLGRSVSVSSDGLVVVSGLGTRHERTVRAGRTHAVRLSRRLGWWGADLWTVTALSGASAGADEQEDEDEISGAIVTAADARAALAVAQEALPDLARLDRGLLADVWPAPDDVAPGRGAEDRAANVLRVPRRGWWLHPLTWRVRVAALAADGLLVRTGRLAPRVTFVPLRHVQGVRIVEGPLLRRAGVAAVDVGLVDGPIRVTVGPFERHAAHGLVDVLALAAAEPAPSRRATQDIGPSSRAGRARVGQ